MATAPKPVPASKLCHTARVEKLKQDKGLTDPLPARYEQTDDGIKLRVQDPNALTKDWRLNYKAARPGSEPAAETQRPEPPQAYKLPKDILRRMPDDPLNSPLPEHK